MKCIICKKEMSLRNTVSYNYTVPICGKCYLKRKKEERIRKGLK